MPGASSESGGWPRTAILRRLEKNSQLEIRLGVFQAALHAVEEEASAIQAWLAEFNAAVAGKMNSRNASILDSLSVPMIASSDGAVGVSPTSSERGRG